MKEKRLLSWGGNLAEEIINICKYNTIYDDA
jgi:hypothetical protein